MAATTAKKAEQEAARAAEEALAAAEGGGGAARARRAKSKGPEGAGEVGEAAMLAFLFAISEGLEEYAVTRTRRGLRALLSLVPDTATVLRGGREETVPPSELELGEVMIVKPGERIATDGIIRSGRTALDTSAITGESMPVEAGPGDEVFAGSINGTGVLEVEVTSPLSVLFYLPLEVLSLLLLFTSSVKVSSL